MSWSSTSLRVSLTCPLSSEKDLTLVVSSGHFLLLVMQFSLKMIPACNQHTPVRCLILLISGAVYNHWYESIKAPCPHLGILFNECNHNKVVSQSLNWVMDLQSHKVSASSDHAMSYGMALLGYLFTLNPHTSTSPSVRACRAWREGSHILGSGLVCCFCFFFFFGGRFMPSFR